MAIEAFEPGGVSWTKRISSLTVWSWSRSKPRPLDVEVLCPVDV